MDARERILNPNCAVVCSSKLHEELPNRIKKFVAICDAEPGISGRISPQDALQILDRLILNTYTVFSEQNVALLRLLIKSPSDYFLWRDQQLGTAILFKPG